MTRQLSLLLLAAAVATAAGLAAAGIGGPDAPTASTTSAATSTSQAPPLATPLEPSPAPDRTAPPRVVLPGRDPAIAAAPEPDPADAPDRATRQLRGTGDLLAAVGESSDPVAGGGRTVRFSVEVEVGAGLDPDAVAAAVEEALYDGRSWAATHDLRRVAPDQASLHVVIATPASVDALCARAGLETAGWLSCWNGSVAAINLDRWTDGVGHVDDLAQYRRYVVNHEVGHGLGYGHVDCPGRGMLAPVMQQQTKSLEGCAANEWAYP